MKFVLFCIVFSTLSSLAKSRKLACTCPEADDDLDYVCGNKLSGCLPNTLYQCNGTAPLVVQECTKCIESQPGIDRCSKCDACNRPNIKKKYSTDPKSLYCGDTLQCGNKTIYSCVHNKPVAHQLCTKKCIPGKKDGTARCESCKCPEQGGFCGAHIGCSKHHIVYCEGKDAEPQITQECSECVGDLTFPPAAECQEM